jgi:hypothetical protein
MNTASAVSRVACSVCRFTPLSVIAYIIKNYRKNPHRCFLEATRRAPQAPVLFSYPCLFLPEGLLPATGYGGSREHSG